MGKDVPLQELLSRASNVQPCLPRPQISGCGRLSSTITRVLPLSAIFAPNARFRCNKLTVRITKQVTRITTKGRFRALFRRLVTTPLNVQRSRFAPIGASKKRTPVLNNKLYAALTSCVHFLGVVSRRKMCRNGHVLGTRAIHRVRTSRMKDTQIVPKRCIRQTLKGRRAKVCKLKR